MCIITLHCNECHVSYGVTLLLSAYSDDAFDNEGIDNNVDKADVADYSLTPQLKSSLPNSDFKSDFFHEMNIQEMVFSIPSHFRKYLQEPPEWINKDYWWSKQFCTKLLHIMYLEFESINHDFASKLNIKYIYWRKGQWMVFKW